MASPKSTPVRDYLGLHPDPSDPDAAVWSAIPRSHRIAHIALSLMLGALVVGFVHLTGLVEDSARGWALKVAFGVLFFNVVAGIARGSMIASARQQS